MRGVVAASRHGAPLRRSGPRLLQHAIPIVLEPVGREDLLGLVSVPAQTSMPDSARLMPNMPTEGRKSLCLWTCPSA